MAEGRGVGAPVAALVVNAFAWGVSWWPFRALQAHGLHPLWATAIVYLLPFAFFLFVRPAALRAFARQPLLWVLLLAAGCTNVGFNWAVTIGDVVRVVLLFYLMPAWSVLLAWLVLGDRLTGGGIGRVLLALAGVATVLGAGPEGLPIPSGLADWLALGGGFSFAFTNVMLLRLADVPAPSRVLAMFGGGAAMAGTVALVGTLQGGIPPVPALPAGALVIAVLLAAGFLVGNLGLQYGAARLPAHTTALVMLSEVVFASLSSIALGAAHLTPGTLVGGLMVVGAAAWSAWPTGPGTAHVH